MLWAAFVFLLLAWLAGVVASYTLGGAIHVLLALAVLVLLLQVITYSPETPRSSKRIMRPGQRNQSAKDEDAA